MVGGAITILKNMSSSMGRIIPYIMESKTCSKSPTRYIYMYTMYIYLVQSEIANVKLDLVYSGNDTYNIMYN